MSRDLGLDRETAEAWVRQEYARLDRAALTPEPTCGIMSYMESNPNCPACGSPMEYVPDGLAEIEAYSKESRRVERTVVRRAFAACTGCEFIYDGVFHGLDAALVPGE